MDGVRPMRVYNASMLGCGAVGVVTGWLLCGWVGVAAAGAAWCVCWVSGLLALWLAGRFTDPQQVAAQVLWGMLPRTGIPLGVCLVAYLAGGMLVECGFVYYILVFYFVTLIVETGLMVRHGPGSATKMRTR